MHEENNRRGKDEQESRIEKRKLTFQIKFLGMNKVPERWIPRIVLLVRKMYKQEICEENLMVQAFSSKNDQTTKRECSLGFPNKIRFNAMNTQLIFSPTKQSMMQASAGKLKTDGDNFLG